MVFSPPTVIPDTLRISYSRSLTGQPMPEGSELTLTCSAGIQSEQLTHLSVTFGKRGSADGAASTSGGEVSTVREIISLDKMLEVVPGRGYKKRYEDGEITLEKKTGEGGLAMYVMKVKTLQPDDTGSYYCEASQWIRDPDRSWQKIAQRTLDVGNLTVQQLGWCATKVLTLWTIEMFPNLPNINCVSIATRTANKPKYQEVFFRVISQK